MTSLEQNAFQVSSPPYGWAEERLPCAGRAAARDERDKAACEDRGASGEAKPAFCVLEFKPTPWNSSDPPWFELTRLKGEGEVYLVEFKTGIEGGRTGVYG